MNENNKRKEYLIVLITFSNIPLSYKNENNDGVNLDEVIK